MLETHIELAAIHPDASPPGEYTDRKSALPLSPASQDCKPRGPYCHVEVLRGIYLASFDVLVLPLFPDLLHCGHTLLVIPVCETNHILAEAVEHIWQWGWNKMTFKVSFNLNNFMIL